MRSLRGLGVALAILTLTAGAALASRPLPDAAGNGTDHAPGLEIAAEAAGKTVPPGLVADEALTDEELAPTEEESEEPAEEETEEAEDNHGATVSEAAQGETPDGWKNHGAYVSAVARGLVDVGAEAPPEAEENGGRMPKPEKPPKP